MTGYKSKRAMARDRMIDDDDDTQVYKDHGDALTIPYQSGYYDGKKAAQPAQPEQEHVATVRCIHGITIGYLEIMQPVGTKLYTAPTQRPLVGLTDDDWKEIEDMPDTFDQGVAWCLARLKERNA
jgi:hypothetical protein